MQFAEVPHALFWAEGEVRTPWIGSSKSTRQRSPTSRDKWPRRTPPGSSQSENPSTFCPRKLRPHPHRNATYRKFHLAQAARQRFPPRFTFGGESTSSPRLPSFSDSANGPRQTCIAIARLLCSSSGPTSRHGILMRIDRR